MNNYSTPVKEVIYRYGVSPFQREGDWICNYCHNLNFAFRKRCNRCKMQTRQENEESMTYFYAYDSMYYPKQQTPTLKDITNTSHGQHLTPPRKMTETKKETSEEYMGRTLPSVSPLVKKYKSIQQKESNKADRSDSQIQTSKRNLQLWGGEWEKDFDDYCEQSADEEAAEEDADNQYIEQLMNNILC